MEQCQSIFPVGGKKESFSETAVVVVPVRSAKRMSPKQPCPVNFEICSSGTVHGPVQLFLTSFLTRDSDAIISPSAG